MEAKAVRMRAFATGFDEIKVHLSKQYYNGISHKFYLKNLKTEVANELGMSNYEQTDKGNLTARQNGYVGGYMTKRLVEMAEKQLSGK